VLERWLDAWITGSDADPDAKSDADPDPDAKSDADRVRRA